MGIIEDAVKLLYPDDNAKKDFLFSILQDPNSVKKAVLTEQLNAIFLGQSTTLSPEEIAERRAAIEALCISSKPLVQRISAISAEISNVLGGTRANEINAIFQSIKDAIANTSA